MTIAELAAKYEQYVIDMRREFHENPELSHHEERTVRRIREELADVLSYCVLMADVCGLMGTSGHAWGRGSCGTPRAEAGQGPRSALRISRWRF